MSKPQLFIIPWQYDYHERAHILVLASSQSAALKIAKDAYAKDVHYESTPKWDEIKLLEDSVYFNYGCDC